MLLFGAAGIGALVLAIHGLSAEDAAPAAPVPAPVVRRAAPVVPAVTPGLASADALATAASRPADCLIEPSQVVKVNSSVEGVIASIAADRGQFVHSGQVVAQLRSAVEAAGVAVARARAANVYSVGAAESRARYLGARQARSERLSRYLAKDSVEEAQANAQAAAMQTSEAQLVRRVASLEYAQQQRLLAERTVRSPIDGVVTERAMAPGEYRANQSSHIMTIAQLDPLHVEVFAPISQLRSVSLGDIATIFPEDPVGGSYQARIKVIDRVFDAASGTFGMRLELRNPGNRLPAGLRCRIQFAT
jgi:RND family efflux transporter MFP subunit